MGDQSWGRGPGQAPPGAGASSPKVLGGLKEASWVPGHPQCPGCEIHRGPHTTCDFAGPESSPVVENSRKLNTRYRCGIYFAAKPALTQQEATHSLCEPLEVGCPPPRACVTAGSLAGIRNALLALALAVRVLGTQTCFFLVCLANVNPCL